MAREDCDKWAASAEEAAKAAVCHRPASDLVHVGVESIHSFIHIILFALSISYDAAECCRTGGLDAPLSVTWL